MEKQKNVPDLRFPEFVGEWKVKTLGDFFIERNELTDEQLPLYSLTIENGVVPKTERYERSYLVNDLEDAYKVMQKDDFAFNPMNLRFGALAKLKYDGKVLVSKYYNIFYCNDTANAGFMEAYLTSYNMLLYYNKMASGSLIEKKRVHYLDFIKFKKRLPTLPEQTKIANFLTAIDTKIQQLTQKKTLLEEYKKGVMQQLFSQKIRFKDENGKDYPDWEEKRLGDIARFSKGKGISKSDIVENGATECIRYGELYTRYGEVINEVYSKTNANTKELVFSEANDVIIPASGETQIDIATASCVIKSGIALGGDLNIIKTKNNGVFLSYYLNNVKKMDIAVLAQGISVVHLYSSQLALLSLKLPSIAEQNKITDFLNSVEVKIQSINKQIEQTQAYKKGLLQQMFI
ncbi:restriction endonuclease subunit S [Runella zeae]|uniref:restriction endonuclease subunit S n=1 Tax=Runella zeae TaxID=94255 RepID=UPI00041CA00A|nr:restriction endonuclease subunit S [Runella zeae]